MNKVLIITYYWPPSGGAGVQRWLKFSKYLPEFGWEPIILTVDPEYAAYPVTDNSLSSELTAATRVFKTPATDYFSIYKKDKSRIPTAGFANSVDNTLKGKLLRFIRGNFFIPDPRKGWNKFAFKKACELIQNENIKHIITTSPPHSTQLIGLKLKKRFPEIKWIADLRDPWTEIYYYKQFYPTFLSKILDSGYEKSVLKNADRILTVGNSLKESFSLKVKGIENKTDVISNGYDDSDFKDVKPVNPARFTITYVGTLSDIYPLGGIVNALKKFKSEGNDFLLRFVGTVPDKSKNIILSGIADSSLEFIPYVSHNKAVNYMMNSSVLLLIIPSHSSNRSIITGKLFEYLASGKPILCVGPGDGDAARIIEKCKSGITCGYDESDEISAFMKNTDSYSGQSDKSAVNDFSRISLTQKIVESLNKM
ncbi:MAG: glycosyltransferase family 4 protein [Bacteroidales bacterium]|nr:glycosyltransferase family 4 protein [Bacteroidales bacterium]